MEVQSVLVSRNLNFPNAVKWLLKNGYNFYKVDKTEHYWRFRQKNPENFERFFTKDIGNGHKLIIGLK